MEGYSLPFSLLVKIVSFKVFQESSVFKLLSIIHFNCYKCHLKVIIFNLWILYIFWWEEILIVIFFIVIALQISIIIIILRRLNQIIFILSNVKIELLYRLLTLVWLILELFILLNQILNLSTHCEYLLLTEHLFLFKSLQKNNLMFIC